MRVDPQVWLMGGNAYQAGDPRGTNPYLHGDDRKRRSWDDGWVSAQAQGAPHTGSNMILPDVRIKGRHRA